jgi:GTP cyclohydrolase II
VNHDLGVRYGPLCIINIVPVELSEEKWLCIAFEDVSMGDFMHFAFLYQNNFRMDKDLLEAAKGFFDNQVPLLRIHSECFLGDVVGSTLCDCGEQLQKSLKLITENKSGILVYLRQEGRGIGMRAKLPCLALQEGYYKGVRTELPVGTYEANLILGYKGDARNYDAPLQILNFLNVKEVDLISGNPNKRQGLINNGIHIRRTIDIDRKRINWKGRMGKELLEKRKLNYQYENISFEEEP